MILSLKAGMSSGLRLVVNTLSTTTSSSTPLPHAVGAEDGKGLAWGLARALSLPGSCEVGGRGSTGPVNPAASEAPPGRVRARTRRSVAVDVGGLLDDLQPAPEARGVEYPP